MGEGLSYRPHASNIDSTEVGEDNPLPVQIRSSAGVELGSLTHPLIVQDAAGNTDAVTVADGADVCEGATTDAAVTTDASGTLSGKVRGLVKLLAACLPASLGQALMAASTPVVIASNQSAVPGSIADGSLVALGTTTDAAVTSDANGTALGKLRGLVKILNDVWGSANHVLTVSAMLNGPSSSLGGTTSMPADGDANTQAHLQYAGVGSLRYYVRKLLYNGTSWDLMRSNVSTTLLASASRTTTAAGTSADQVSFNARRMVLIVNVSDATGGGSITPSLQVKDSVSGNYFTVWTASAALVAAATSAYLFADGATGGSWTESKAFGVPGRAFRLVCTANNASALVYSASLELMT